MNLQNQFKVTTNYNFKLYRNDELLREENTHNVLCNTVFAAVNGTTAEFGAAKLWLGKGTGTPAATDTALFSRIWPSNSQFIADSSIVTSQRQTEDENGWVQIDKKYTIPASSDYVGTVTECALVSGITLATHALLLDAEGNPISITKTDLDILIVNVSIRFIFVDTTSVKMDRADKSVVANAFMQTNGTGPLYNNVNNNVEVLWSREMALSGVDNRLWGIGSLQAPPYCSNTCVSSSLPPSNDTGSKQVRKLVAAGYRLGSNFVSDTQQFIKGLRIGNLFIVPFPNPDVFPAYTISNMDVGTGDGSTTEFVCPMNYFVKDTDVIYVNGIAKVRGVDYTVESDNNNQACSTLMASNEAVITGGYISGSTNQVYAPLFRAALNRCKAATSGNYYEYPDALDSNRPIFLDMKAPTKVNYFQIGNIYKGAASSGGYKYTLWYSNDGEEYTEATNVIKTSMGTDAAIATFDTITARYWKVTIGWANGSSGTIASDSLVAYESRVSASGLTTPIPAKSLCLVGYKGHGIQFTTPPPAGAVITMDAQTDLPMKNDKFVFDVDLTLTF